MTLGDASTKFFHVNATIKYRRILTTCLETDDEVSVFDHQHKADMIWAAFKERLGVSEFSSIHFDTDTFIQPIADLSSLVIPFDKQEIDLVVRSLPTNKASGPDGFNTDFVKRC